MRVAVIGAGAAGLCALRHLVSKPEVFQAQAFEQTSVVGGTWVYNNKVGHDEHGLPIHASMYQNLRTNLPKEVMAFPDFPFKKDQRSFISHEDVRSYLQHYAQHFRLTPHIQFDTVVQHVIPLEKEGVTQWQVKVSPSVDKADSTTHTFDAVIVCNGHYSEPLVPTIPGLTTFPGAVLHSHDYRHPETFQGKVVLCLGAAASGQDITLDLGASAKHEMDGGEAILSDGSRMMIDVLLFCTGYKYVYPFLDRACRPHVSSDQRATPLYKHIIHVDHPTMSIIGVCKTICPFPQFDCQVRFVLAALEGTMMLPSHEDMLANIEADFQWRLSQGMPARYAHTLGKLQWAYNDDLAELAGFAPIPRVVRNLYDHVHANRATQLPSYKSKNYVLLSDTDFKEITDTEIT